MSDAEKERAAIVAWLRGEHDRKIKQANRFGLGSSPYWDNLSRAATFGGIADSLERGDHLENTNG